MGREARIVFSDARGGISAIASSTERTERTLEKATIELEDARIKLAEIGTAGEDQSRRDRTQRTIDRQMDRATGAETKLVEMAAEKIELEPQVAAAAQER